MRRSVVCLQNHDQTGNRANGERLHHGVPPPVWRAASAVLLTAPMTPLLFMGQEWAASSPFQYFTDLEPEFGRLVTAGRRHEFSAFPEFSNTDLQKGIPDPQAASTFEASRLRWSETGAGEHALTLALYRALIALRLDHPALGADDERSGEAFAPDANTLVTRRTDGESVFWIAATLRGAGLIDLPAATERHSDWDTRQQWTIAMTTEDPLFASDPALPEIDTGRGLIRFARPGAVILKRG